MNRLLRIFAHSLTMIAFVRFCLPCVADGLAKDLLLYLPLDRDLSDQSTNNHPVEAVGRVPIDAGGASFGGRRQWIEAPHIELNNRPFAVAFWLEDTSVERSVGLVEQLDRIRAHSHLHIMLRGNRQPYFGFRGSDLVSPVGVPRDGGWTHLVFQFTGTHQQIWMNGHLICTRESAPYAGEFGVTTIGKAPRWEDFSSKDLVGRVRDFRIYGRTLSANEIDLLKSDRQKRSSAGKIADSATAPANITSQGMEAFLPANASVPFMQMESDRLIVSGLPGQVYTLLRSQDFAIWENVARFTNVTGQVVVAGTNIIAGISGFFYVEVSKTER